MHKMLAATAIVLLAALSSDAVSLLTLTDDNKSSARTQLSSARLLLVPNSHRVIEPGVQAPGTSTPSGVDDIQVPRVASQHEEVQAPVGEEEIQAPRAA
jgi:hypothetical protein